MSLLGSKPGANACSRPLPTTCVLQEITLDTEHVLASLPLSCGQQGGIRPGRSWGKQNMERPPGIMETVGVLQGVWSLLVSVCLASSVAGNEATLASVCSGCHTVTAGPGWMSACVSRLTAPLFSAALQQLPHTQL